MIVLLDSSRSTELWVGLYDRKLVVLRKRYDHPASSELLRIVDELLRKRRVSIKQLRGIVVASGPGPFSALRVACALANAMSFSLQVPAVGVRGELTMHELLEQGRKKLARARLGITVVPFYGKEPNITKRRRR